MYKRILALSLLSFAVPATIFADATVEKSERKEKTETKDFFDEFLDDDLSFEEKPQIYVSLYPRWGVNFILSDKNEDQKDFSILRSRSAGATLAINMPIKSYNFFYSVAFDFSCRTFQWQTFKNFYSQSLWIGTGEQKKEYNELLQNDFKEEVKFSRINFWDLDAMMQFGYKSHVMDHREGFFVKGILGIGFQFSESVDTKKKDFLIETKTDSNVPLKNVKFLYGVEVGYWRVGLNFIGDFNHLFKDKEENYKGLELDVSRNIIPFSLSIFFDVF